VKHLDITQPVATAAPVASIYYACTLPGCAARFYLPQDQRLRSLPVHAEAAGWHVDTPGGERCPDHYPGRPLQLEAGRLDSTTTMPEPPAVVQFNMAQVTPLRSPSHRMDVLRRVLAGLLRLDEPKPVAESIARSHGATYGGAQ